MKIKKSTLLICAFIIICLSLSYLYISNSNHNQTIGSNTIEANPESKIGQSQSTKSTAPKNNNEATEQANADTNKNNEKIQSTPQNNPQNQPDRGEKPDPAKQEELKNAIIAKYESSLLSLKNESLEALNNLIAQAKAELNSLPENKKTTSKISLGLKYLKLGRELESQCDDKFDSLVSQMEQELKSNGFSTEAVDAAKKQYAAEKSERKKTLLSKAF